MLDLLWHHFEAGGWAMWLILFWLVCAIVIIVERALYLFASHQDTDAFTATVLALVAQRNFTQSIVVAQSAKTPLGRVVQAGLQSATQSPKKIQESMDEAALTEMPKLSKRVPLLALFANLAMLCGLFGTIVGLIKAFGAVGGANVEHGTKARILAEGISEAMNCTAFGLMSAIVALIGFSLLNAWIQSLEDDIHSETVKVFNALIQGRHIR